ncbi:uncharacterized protein N7477_005818 [Penicillium maclennaniae]|uniref:uncharacterized protein n=1 Tax=Penicillium maclennaniae TaxID=1343394 RepID=UPI0025401D3A|nr:uncharacterized protein N7477_005818 [Penicillium maclennaniae]KAJ5670455.1 hypothetical protein N7477_005818 [Penicillium maclennaniae]
MLWLGATIKCDNRDESYGPLLLTAAEGNKEIVKLLLEHDPSIVHATAGCGDRALKIAISRGHHEVVKILLTQSILDPSANQQDLDDFMGDLYHLKYKTPMNEALASGNEEMAQILMEDGRFKLDHDSLSAASEGGSENLVKMCLQVSFQEDEYWEKCPLSCAASEGHGSIVKLLLEDGRLDPSAKDRYGRTPLHCAVSRGFENIVSILLDREDVDPDVKDMSMVTPLSDAAKFGHTGIIRLLLGSSQVDPDTRDIMQRTPLSHASVSGEPAAVSLLLATGKVDPESKCCMGRTPLSWAALSGCPDTFRVLLETGRVDLNSVDEEGRTPLSLAVGGLYYTNKNKTNGWAQALSDIRHLLRGRTDLGYPPNAEPWQRGPRGAPAKHDPLDVIEQLLACDEVTVDAPDNRGQTPLMWAAQRRQVEMVRLLMATGKVNPIRRDDDGWTPETHAEKGCKPTSPAYDAAGSNLWESPLDGRS